MKKENVIFIAVSFFVFIYLLLRAIWLPLLHDEIATFYFYVQPAKFFPPGASWDANNHFLNSILSHFSVRLLGENSFALRLPNLVFLILFFNIVFRFSKELSNNSTRILFQYSLLLGLPFLEYYGISRGYGISMTCLMFSLFHFFKYLQSQNISELIKSLLWMQLMLSANLSLIISSLIIISIIPLITLWILKDRNSKTKQFAIWLLFGVAPLFLWLLLSFEYKKRGLLYEGYPDSFYLNSFKTIVPVITGRINSASAEILISITLLTIALLFLLANRKTKDLIHLFTIGNASTILLFGNILSSILMANILKVNYPSERIGIYWWPYMIISLAFLFDKLLNTTTTKHNWLLLIPAMIALNGISTISFSNTSAYTPHGLLPQVYFEKVKQLAGPNWSDKNIGSDITREFVWSWLNFKSGGQLNACETNFPECDYDFVIADSVKNKNALKNYRLLANDPYSNYALYQYKGNFSRDTLIEKNNISTLGPINQEFFTLSEGSSEQLNGKKIEVKLKGELQTGGRSFSAFIQISAVNKKGEIVLYQRFMLNALRTKWNFKDVLNHSFVVPKFPVDANSYNVCIWNHYKKPFALQNAGIRLMQINSIPDAQ